MKGRFIFLHGILQRSGTNYLLHLLSRHPSIQICPRRIWEFPFLSLCRHLVEFNSEMARHPKVLDVAEGDLLPRFGRAFLQYLAEGVPEDRRILLKQPSVENIERVFDFFPQARVVLIVRDGRDIACSAMRTTFAAPPGFKWRYPGTYRFLGTDRVELMAERWVGASRTVRAFLLRAEKTGFRDQVNIVRYEDLVREPGQVLRLLLESLDFAEEGVGWDDLERLPVRGSSFLGNTADVGLDWNPGGVGTRDLGSVGRWHAWADSKKRSFQRVAGDELRFWGYGEESDGALSPDLAAWVVTK